MIFTGAVINYDDAGGTPARQPARCRRYKVLYGRNLEVRTMARISLIEPNQASSEVKEIYEKLLKGKPGNVQKAIAHRPEVLKHFLAFYGSVGRSLERRLYEMVYIRVSMVNGCNY